ncbi:hypothetical protein BDW59DRAFT_158281 [Aspergillus cavernicola]|uniref:DUF7136 domain-containing protein n=1 Tax=Aspergillus cavernicola TaxID=176166 RepID=A0ABR4ISU4_9EURO
MALIITFLASIWLAPAVIAAKADIDYPATIEVDLLFPRNETYNSNLTGIPVVLAVQNAQAAYAYEWSIAWRVFHATSSPSDSPSISGRSRSKFGENEFLYLFNDVAIVPMVGQNVVVILLNPGEFRLEWDYATTPCIPEGESSVYQTRTPIASGTHYFSIVDDGSGLDYDIPLDDCPIYGDSWAVESEEGCPISNDENDREGNPCAAKLETQEQVTCIWEYLTRRRNETETCLSAFERADPDWSMYYYPPFSDDGPSESDEPEGEDDSSSEDPDNSTIDDVDEDFAVSHRPLSLVLVVTAILAVAIAL